MVVAVVAVNMDVIVLASQFFQWIHPIFKRLRWAFLKVNLYLVNFTK
jgi:hypothetical protein